MKQNWKVQAVSPKNLDAKTIKRLKKLSLGNEGLMCKYLDGLLAKEYRGKICVVKVDNKIVGWSLLAANTLQVYVHKEYRCQGIGKSLVKAGAKNQSKYYEHVGVYTHGGGKKRRKVFKAVLKKNLVHQW